MDKAASTWSLKQELTKLVLSKESLGLIGMELPLRADMRSKKMNVGTGCRV